MARFVALFLLATHACPGGMSGGAAGQTDAWFRATFDGDITLSIITARGGCGDPPRAEDCYEAHLDGSDQSGFHWIEDLDSGVLGCGVKRDTEFSTLIGADKTFSDYAELELQDKGGEHGMVLYMKMITWDLDSVLARSRLEFQCHINSPRIGANTVLNNGYLAFDLWLQPDLQTTIDCVPNTCFRQLGEWWDKDDDARMTWGLTRDQRGDDTWYWKFSFQEKPIDKFQTIWEVIDDVNAIPLNQWLRFEMEWTQDETTGSARAWVNGTQVLDKIGQTSDGDMVGHIDFMVVYTNAPNSWQYIDNIVICGSRSECG